TVSDHFQPWRHDGGHAPFSLSWLTAVGERTERLQLGTSVLTPTFRYNPAVLAQAFATMACLYPGRVFLGVGTGEALNQSAAVLLKVPEGGVPVYIAAGGPMVDKYAGRVGDVFI